MYLFDEGVGVLGVGACVAMLVLSPQGGHRRQSGSIAVQLVDYRACKLLSKGERHFHRVLGKVTFRQKSIK